MKELKPMLGGARVGKTICSGPGLLASDSPTNNRTRLLVWQIRYSLYQMAKPKTSMRDFCENKDRRK